MSASPHKYPSRIISLGESFATFPLLRQFELVPTSMATVPTPLRAFSRKQPLGFLLATSVYLNNRSLKLEVSAEETLNPCPFP